MALGDLRWQEFEEDSWIDSVKSSHNFVGLDHVSSFSSLLNLSRQSRSSYKISAKPGTSRVALLKVLINIYWLNIAL